MTMPISDDLCSTWQCLIYFTIFYRLHRVLFFTLRECQIVQCLDYNFDISLTFSAKLFIFSETFYECVCKWRKCRALAASSKFFSFKYQTLSCIIFICAGVACNENKGFRSFCSHKSFILPSIKYRRYMQVTKLEVSFGRMCQATLIKLKKS